MNLLSYLGVICLIFSLLPIYGIVQLIWSDYELNKQFDTSNVISFLFAVFQNIILIVFSIIASILMLIMFIILI